MFSFKKRDVHCTRGGRTSFFQGISVFSHREREVRASLRQESERLEEPLRRKRKMGTARAIAVGLMVLILSLAGGRRLQSATTTLSSGTTTLSADALESNANDIVVGSGARLELNVTRQVNPTSLFTISGSGTVVKLGTDQYGLGDHALHVYFGLSAGGLLDIQAGKIMNNWGSATLAHFGNNQGSLNIAASGTMDFWGEYAQIDALSGAGLVQSTYPYITTHDLKLGVAGGSGVFSGVIRDKDPSMFTTGTTLYLPLKVTKSGSGTQVFSGTSTYTGATTVSAGVLNIQNSAALGSTVGDTTVASGAALQIQGGISVGAEALTLNGTGVSSDGALRNMSGTNSYAGAITLGSASRINSDSNVLTLSGGVSGAYPLTVGGDGNSPG